VSAKLTAIAQREGFPYGRPVQHDIAQYQHQVPGGMLTNLRHQLKLVGMENRYDQVLEECARVREEWGWPIMVTPLSQFVGSQAAINVITGERYKEVTDQTILYALGYWGGQEAIDGLDPNTRDRILAHPRARELTAAPPREPTPADLRARFGGPGVSDEELLLRLECSAAELTALRAAGPPRPYDHLAASPSPTPSHRATTPPSQQPLDAASPIVALVAHLTRRPDHHYVHVQKGPLTLTLARTTRHPTA
jgi:oxaloacetate decarboxylase alpha subunit